VKERLTAGEVCTRVVTVAFKTTSVNEAARLMRQHHVGSLPVVDETDRGRIVVGMLTDRDIVTAVVAHELQPAALRVEDVMTEDVVTAREEDSLADVLAAMRRNGVRRVPVTGAAGELIGMVAMDDVLEIVVEELDKIVQTIRTQSKREQSIRQ
jgi:CBS domain-containing protein